MLFYKKEKLNKKGIKKEQRYIQGKPYQDIST